MYAKQKMQSSATDERGVCLSVRPPVRPEVSLYLSCGQTRLQCAKTAEQIKLSVDVSTLVGPLNIVLYGLNGCSDAPTAKGRRYRPTLVFWDAH